MACTETKLDNAADDMEINIEGFVFLRKDTNRFGGGVGLYLKDDLNYLRLVNLENSRHELFRVNISWPNCCLICGVCYRPPVKINLK